MLLVNRNECNSPQAYAKPAPAFMPMERQALNRFNAAPRCFVAPKPVDCRLVRPVRPVIASTNPAESNVGVNQRVLISSASGRSLDAPRPLIEAPARVSEPDNSDSEFSCVESSDVDTEESYQSHFDALDELDEIFGSAPERKSSSVYVKSMPFSRPANPIVNDQRFQRCSAPAPLSEGNSDASPCKLSNIEGSQSSANKSFDECSPISRDGPIQTTSSLSSVSSAMSEGGD